MADRLSLRRPLARQLVDPAIAATVAAIAIAAVLAHPRHVAPVRGALVIAAMAGALAVRRRWPFAGACAAAAVLAAARTPGGSVLTSVTSVASVLLAYSCGAYADGWRSVAGVFALVAGLQTSVGFSEFPNIELGFITFGPWWVGTELRRRRQLLRALATRAAELEAEQDAFTRLSVRRERARVARELHDIVAHHLAVMVVQAGAGRVTAPGRSSHAAERFAAIQQSGDQALAEMARLIDVLEADTAHEASPLDRLRVLFAETSGVEVRFSALPAEVHLPVTVEETAYRVVQEGLTNAIKHAPGAQVEVRLALADGDLEIAVRDGGATTASALAGTGSGLGLTGMRERVEALGGGFTAGRNPGGGWCLHARLPVNP